MASTQVSHMCILLHIDEHLTDVHVVFFNFSFSLSFVSFLTTGLSLSHHFLGKNVLLHYILCHGFFFYWIVVSDVCHKCNTAGSPKADSPSNAFKCTVVNEVRFCTLFHSEV